MDQLDQPSQNPDENNKRFDIFWKIQSGRVRQELKNLVDKEDKDDEEYLEDVERQFENEREFCRIIYDKVQALTQESPKEIILLFDIDDTIGIVRGDKFIVRPSFGSFLEELKAKFPNIRIGILSNRPLERLNEQISDPETAYSFAEVGKYFDKDLVYSSRGEKIYTLSSDTKKKLRALLPKIDFDEEERLSLGQMEKLHNYAKIADEHPKTQVMLVDDMVPEKFSHGKNFVRTYEVMPSYY